MAHDPLGLVLRHLRRRLGAPAVQTGGDDQLLEQFVRSRDEAAFDALLQRHGPMVLGVCRRVLFQEQDAEDAFQATFLLLVRNAGAIRRRASVAGWLYRVAHHLALRMRADVARRARERRADPRRPAAPAVEAAWRELQAVLDEELALLPEKYRAPLVLCYLEGRTHEEAARVLGWPAGTVKGRLARARDLLRRRLIRRGLAPVAGSFATVLAVHAAGAAVPVPLATAVARAALLTAGGQVVGAAPAHVTALVEAMTRAAFLAKLRTAAAVVLAVGLLAGGAGLLVRRAGGDGPPAAGDDRRPAASALPAPLPPAADPQVRTDRHGDALPEGALARLGTVRWRVGAPVYHFTYSPDGRTLATGGEQVIYVWKAATGAEVRRLTGHRNRVLGVAFAPDGRTLASGSADTTIRLWDLATGAELRCFQGHQGTVGHILFAPDGRTLVSGSSDKTVRVWEVATGRELRRLGDDPAGTAPVTVWPIAFLPDNRTVATRDFRHTLRLWDAATGKELPRTEWLPKKVSAADFSPDGKTLAAACAGDPTVRLWEVATGRELGQLRGHRGTVPALAFAPDGATLASAAVDRTLRFWDVTTRQELRQVVTGETLLNGLAFSPDGATLVAGRDTLLRFWEAATGRELHPSEGHRGQVRMAAFLPDGRGLLTTGTDSTLRRWDPATGAQLDRWDGPPQDPGAFAFALAPDGRLLALGSNRRVIHVRDAATGRELRQWQGHQEHVSCLAFAPDGRTLASGSWDKTIGLWDAATGRELRRLHGHTREILCVAFSPDGRLVASAGMDGAVRLWDAATGEALRTCGDALSWVRAVAFAPDGKTVAAASGAHGARGGRGLVSLWEVATGRERGRWEGHHERTYCVAFSPDGATLLSGGGDQKVRRWDLATGREQPPLEGHRGAVVSVAFSPDGRCVASGSMDTTALIWPMADRPRQETPAPLIAEQLEALWVDLAGTDAARAYRAVWTLAGAPGQAVPLLQARLSPPGGDSQPGAAPDVHALRAIEVLERTGAPRARRVLESLAKGAWPTSVAVEAKAALARLAGSSRADR